MLRITVSTSSAGAKKYFREGLAREDYYSKDQVIQGRWFGLGAERLGLGEIIQKEDFYRLCDNLNPNTGESMTGRTKSDRRVGFDCMVTAPKSVSLLLELTQDERIVEVFQEAVASMMKDMEKEARVRVTNGDAFETVKSGNLLGGVFIHTTARPVNGVPDPALHAHPFVFNHSWDEEKQQWKAVDFGNLKRDAPYFEAVMDARLAKGMYEIGYDIERHKRGWDIAGIEKSTLDKFSLRTQQIEEYAREKGIVDDRQKDGIGAITREDKNQEGEYSKEDLRRIWWQRLDEGERDGLRKLVQATSPRKRLGMDISEREQLALDYALKHELQNKSVVLERSLLRSALKYGTEGVTIEGLLQSLKARKEVIRIEHGDRFKITTHAVLDEEEQMLALERGGRGTRRALNADFVVNPVLSDGNQLNEQQIAAIEFALKSPDNIIAIEGGAGVGKTTLMKEVVRAIQQNDRSVFALAPSTPAVDVLRKEGASNAQTVQKLLVDTKFQERIKDAVLWVDEIGLLSTQQALDLFTIAKEQNARLLLTGDARQHKSVERGDTFRILQQYGMPTASVREIVRQKDAYKEAVEFLSHGRLTEGFNALEDMGAIKEVPEMEAREKSIVETALKEDLKKILIISPTHLEGNRISAKIRQSLKQRGVIAQEDTQVTSLRRLNLTDAEKTDAVNYSKGMKVQFHHKAKNEDGAFFEQGERFTVNSVNKRQNTIELTRKNGKIVTLPTEHTKRFSVYQPYQLALADGDTIRATQVGHAFDAKGKRHKLPNGNRYIVQSVSDAGDITLSNGWVIDRNFNHIARGYVATSHAAQGKTTTKVFLSQTQMSATVASLEQFYVSVSRGKKSIEIFTDDKQAMLQAVQDSDRRTSAHELLQQTGHGSLNGKIATSAYGSVEQVLSSDTPDLDILPAENDKNIVREGFQDGTIIQQTEQEKNSSDASRREAQELSPWGQGTIGKEKSDGDLSLVEKAKEHLEKIARLKDFALRAASQGSKAIGWHLLPPSKPKTPPAPPPPPKQPVKPPPTMGRG